VLGLCYSPCAGHTAIWPSCRSKFRGMSFLQAGDLGICDCRVESWSTDLAALAKFKNLVAHRTGSPIVCSVGAQDMYRWKVPISSTYFGFYPAALMRQ
jgi:hypothetical protein